METITFTPDLTTGEMIETVHTPTRRSPQFYLDQITSYRQYIADDVVRHQNSVTAFETEIDKNQAAFDACMTAGLPDPRV